MNPGRLAALFCLVALFLRPFYRGSLDSPAAQAPSGTAATGDGASRSSFVRTTLQNGMELQVLEQPDAESVRLALVFRAGAAMQTEKTAGLFRFLEFALFRGRVADPGEPEPAGALEALGASGLEGGAAEDRFGISFDILPDRAEAGLDTLAYLFSTVRIDSALGDPAGVEAARALALGGISAASGDPALVFEAAMAGKLFAKAPWRLDPAGADYVVRSATTESLMALASTWLTPDNALLAIAGKVDSATVTAHAAEIFGSWKRSAVARKPAAAHPKPGVTRPTFIVYPDPSVDPGEAFVEMRYRGPDAGTSIQSATTAVLWTAMASSPSGKLASGLSKALPKAAAPGAPAVAYHESRDAAWLSVSVRIALEAASNTADRALAIKEDVRGTQMYAMKTNPSYFTAGEFEEARKTLAARRESDLSSPAGAVRLMADSWAAGGPDWFQSLPELLRKKGAKDIASFADEYFMRNLEVTAVRINPADYASRKKNFSAYGFEQVNPAKAWWWM